MFLLTSQISSPWSCGVLTAARRGACLHFGMSLQQGNENTSLPPRDAINTVKIMSCADETGHKCPSERPIQQDAWTFMGLPLGGRCPNPPAFYCLVTGVASAFPQEQGCCSYLCCRSAVRLLWKIPSCHVKKKAATCRLHEYAFLPFFFFFHSYFLLLFLLYWSDQMF